MKAERTNYCQTHAVHSETIPVVRGKAFDMPAKHARYTHTCNYSTFLSDSSSSLLLSLSHLHTAGLQHLLHLSGGRANMAPSERLQRRENLVKSLMAAEGSGRQSPVSRHEPPEQPHGSKSHHRRSRAPQNASLQICSQTWFLR